MLAVVFFLVFAPAALAYGAGFCTGRWYQRVVDEPGDYTPTVVLEHDHPERAVAAPVYQFRPRPERGGAA